jgi:hypothetical protein
MWAQSVSFGPSDLARRVGGTMLGMKERDLHYSSPTLDGFSRAEIVRSSDPARQMERLIPSDPARQFERQVKEFERTQRALGPPIDAATRAEELEKRRNRSVEMSRPAPMWDLKPSRNFHLEALADLQHTIRSTAQQKAGNIQSAIFDLIRRPRQQQEGLKKDQQLFVYCGTGPERIQVHEIVLPNNDIMILNGVDGEGNPASLFVTLNNVKIASKVIRLPPPAKPYKIGFGS